MSIYIKLSDRGLSDNAEALKHLVYSITYTVQEKVCIEPTFIEKICFPSSYHLTCVCLEDSGNTEVGSRFLDGPRLDSSGVTCSNKGLT